MAESAEYRIEHDTMGEVRVPVDALWRAQTQRAVENFPISGRGLERTQIRALGLLKGACAQVNKDLGLLSADKADAIIDVNMSQSSNDTFPTATHIAATEAAVRHLIPALEVLHEALDSKAHQWRTVV